MNEKQVSALVGLITRFNGNINLARSTLKLKPFLPQDEIKLYRLSGGIISKLHLLKHHYEIVIAIDWELYKKVKNQRTILKGEPLPYIQSKNIRVEFYDPIIMDDYIQANIMDSLSLMRAAIDIAAKQINYIFDLGLPDKVASPKRVYAELTRSSMNAHPIVGIMKSKIIDDQWYDNLSDVRNECEHSAHNDVFLWDDTKSAVTNVLTNQKMMISGECFYINPNSLSNEEREIKRFVEDMANKVDDLLTSIYTNL